MTELLPCPFCGKKQAQVKHSPRWGWFVSCQCTAVGPGKDSKEGAVRAWNERPDSVGYCKSKAENGGCIWIAD